jgi:hypothetical protein
MAQILTDHSAVRCCTGVSIGIQHCPRGDTAEILDWLSDDSEAPAVLDRADRSE